MIRILAVDDEKPIVELLKLTLNHSGYQCIGAYDGIQAANLIEKETFDLILLDIMLPGIDGFELMDYIRSTGIPVIFLTAKNGVRFCSTHHITLNEGEPNVRRQCHPNLKS